MTVVELVVYDGDILMSFFSLNLFTNTNSSILAENEIEREPGF